MIYPLKFSPASGCTIVGGLLDRDSYRKNHPHQTWFFNPWTGQRRDARYIDSDPYGKLLVPPGEGLKAASWPQLDNVDPAQASKIIDGTLRLDPGKALDAQTRRALATPFPTLEKAPSAPDSPLAVQVGGGHYKDMPIQPVQFIHANAIGYFEGNVIKYVSRWRKKNGVADLEKARHYIDLLIELETRK